MYEKFYNLQEAPFEVTPNPQFLYPTRQHHDALVSLYNRIIARRGFVVISGEVGTGKTLVLRCLLDALEKRRVAHAYIFNSQLSPGDFLRYIALDLGLRPKSRDKSDLLFQLSNFLIDQYKKGSTTVLVVDEAQLLSRQVLEEVRLLTNLENNRSKLLQVVLAGQPELDRRLDLPSLRQLKQRVALRVRLQPLSLEETQGYINWRFELAGCQQQRIFDHSIVQRIHQASAGIPRLINIICDNALISGFAQSLARLTPDVIDEVSRELGLGNGTTTTGERLQALHDRVAAGPNGGRRLTRELLQALGTVLQFMEDDDQSSKALPWDTSEDEAT